MFFQNVFEQNSKKHRNIEKVRTPRTNVQFGSVSSRVSQYNKKKLKF